MNSQLIILPKGGDRRDHACSVIRGLNVELPWKLVIAEYKPQRSDQQNRWLWSMYQQIIEVSGETMRGWTKDDLHEFFLGEWSGWETVEGFGRKRMKPMRRSSALNKQEFSDYAAFIQRYMAERGVYLSDPDEYLAAATVTQKVGLQEQVA